MTGMTSVGASMPTTGRPGSAAVKDLSFPPALGDQSLGSGETSFGDQSLSRAPPSPTQQCQVPIGRHDEQRANQRVQYRSDSASRPRNSRTQFSAAERQVTARTSGDLYRCTLW